MNDNMTLDQLLRDIKSDNADTRTRAWLAATEVGAAALDPLAEIMATGALEVGRAAKRAMWTIARTAGAPDASGRTETVTALVRLLKEGQAVVVRREVLWMLSEVGTGDAVESIAPLLSVKELREDCRATLERIPGGESLAALQAGFRAAPDEFKINLAQSLRKRGVEVDGYPCEKLVPTRETTVKEVE